LVGVTEADEETDPALLLHVMVYVVFEEIFDTVSLPPLTAFDPDHVPPEAVHDVGEPVVVQARLVLIGAVPVVGEADNDTVGATAGTTMEIEADVPPLDPFMQ
jgi:hypothetical protein